MQAKERLIVALDVDTMAEAERLVDQLSGHVGMFKVGLQLVHSAGPQVIQMIRQKGSKVFADFKFHDIPNTVAQAARAVARQGVAIINVHAAGGESMMAEAARAAREEARRCQVAVPLVIGVTVLTSLNEAAVRQEIGIDQPLEQVVQRWALLARKAGLDGVVASPLETRLIRQTCGPDFTVITPGVRPAGAQLHDQKRTMTPAGAIRQGATFVVVGRPVVEAADPVEAAMEIVQELETGSSGE